MNYLADLWQRSFTPPDTREIWEWFTDEGELPGVYGMPGKLDISTCPMIKEPLRALKNPIVRHVVNMCSIQSLKTLIGEIWQLWTIPNDPGPSQWLQRTDEEAKEHAKERFTPLIENFPCVHRLYTPNRHDRTTNFIRFRNGAYLRMEGAENPGNLDRKTVKNQMRSEVYDARFWPPGRLKKADARKTQVYNSKTYTESQPGWHFEFEIDDMHSTFLLGDQNIWNFHCESCKKHQPYLFNYFRSDGTRAGLRWDTTERTVRETNSTDPNQKFRWAELVPTIRFECIHCGHRHHDDPITRRRLNDSGTHVPQRPDAPPDVESFSWNQWAMPNLSWFKTEIGGVQNFLFAHAAAKRGNETALFDFYTKVCAEPYDPARHAAFAAVESIDLRSASEDEKTHAITLDGITFTHRLMNIDVQEDHFWVDIELWSAAGDCLVLWAGGGKDKDKTKCEPLFTWERLRQLQQEFHVPDQNVSVDYSHRTDEVKWACVKFGHWGKVKYRGIIRNSWLCWRAMRGSDQPDFDYKIKQGKEKQTILLPYQWPPDFLDPCRTLPADDKRRQEYRGRRCPVIAWSNSTIKDIVQARYKKEAHIRTREIIATGEWNQEYARHMSSHVKKNKGADGKKNRWVYEKRTENTPDHLHDCRCMGVVRAWQLQLLTPGVSTLAGEQAGK